MKTQWGSERPEFRLWDGPLFVRGGCLGGIVPFLGPGESLRRAHEGLIKKLALHPDSESKREEEGGSRLPAVTL